MKPAKFLRDLFLVGSGQAGSMVATTIQALVLARWLGPNVYGLWISILATFTFLCAFFSFRTADALIAFWPLGKEGRTADRSTLFYSSLYVEILTKTVAISFGFLISPSLANQIDSSHEKLPFAIIALCGFGKLLEVNAPFWMGLVRVEGRLRVLAIVSASQSWCALLLTGVAMLLLPPTAIVAAVSYFVSQCIGFCIRWRTTFAQGGIKDNVGCWTSLISSFKARNEVLPFWRMMKAGYVASCLSSIVKESDVLIVGLLGSASHVGLFKVAKSMATAVQRANAVLGVVITRDLVLAIRNGSGHKIKRKVQELWPWALAVVVGLFAAGLFCIEPVLRMLLGNAYADSKTPFILMLPGVLIAAAMFWVQPLAVAMQASSSILRVAIWNFAVYCVAVFLGALLFGPWAAAAALSVAWIFGNVALLISVWPLLTKDRASIEFGGRTDVS